MQCTHIALVTPTGSLLVPGSAPIKDAQTSTGVKDPYPQFWIDGILSRFKVLSKANHSTPEEIEQELLRWVDENRDKIENPFYATCSFDPTKDTPVEILHTMLLGITKYIWHVTHAKLSTDAKKVYVPRLQATDTVGLSIPAIRAGYILQYAGSLVGRQLKILVQTSVFHIGDLVDDPVKFAAWKAAGELAALLWVPEIKKMDEYCVDLKIAVANVLDVFAVLDPSTILAKMKYHLLCHLDLDAKRLGPLVGFATENYEASNGVFRHCSILSNHLSPSRDIALPLAKQERFKHVITGGSWRFKGESFRGSTSGRAFLAQHPILQKLIGWSKTKKTVAGEVKLVSKKGQKDREAHQLSLQNLPTSNYIPPSRDGSKTEEPSPAPICGVIADILSAENKATLIILRALQLLPERDAWYGMPVLVPKLTAVDQPSYLSSPQIMIATGPNAMQLGLVLGYKSVSLREKWRLLCFHNAHLLHEILPQNLCTPIPLYADQQDHYDSLALRVKSQRAERAAKRKRPVLDEDPVEGQSDGAPPRKKRKVSKSQTRRAPHTVQVAVPAGASLVLNRSPRTVTKSANLIAMQKAAMEVEQSSDEEEADDEDSEPPTDASDNDDEYNEDTVRLLKITSKAADRPSIQLLHRCFNSLLPATTMSPPSPLPTSPSTKPSRRQRLKNFFCELFKSSSLKASVSLPALHILAAMSDQNLAAHGVAEEPCLGSRPPASLNDNGDQTITPQTADSPSPAGTPLNELPSTDSGERTMTPRAADSPSPALTRENVRAQGPDQSSALKEKAKLAWHGFKLVVTNVGEFLDGTPFKIPIAVLNTIIGTADAVIDNKASMAELLLQIRERLEIVSRCKPLPNDVNPTFQRFARALEAAANELQTMLEAGTFKRILESDEDPEQIEDIFRRVDEATKNFELLAARVEHGHFRLNNIIKDNTELIRLRDLLPSQDAKYAGVQREACVKGTRREILENIMSWCKDRSPDTPSIYWLSGMAGTGKSMIAYTICKQLAADGKASRLGASFFCSRQIEARCKRRNIIPTLAHELALELPSFRRVLLDSKVDANPPPLEKHLECLLMTPWVESIGDRGGLPPLVVVVDALDEVENEDGSSFLEQLIKKIGTHPDHFHRLKFFITSCRDPRIVEVAESLPSTGVCCLEDISTATIENDIHMYLRVSLPKLADDQLHLLSHEASRLFIYAATAIRFIIPRPQRPPSVEVQQTQLGFLLKTWPDQFHRRADGLPVDRLYEIILSELLDKRTEVDQGIAISVLHTALCAEEPVLVSDILALLDNTGIRTEDVRDVIMDLHSVLHISSGRVYSYHKSFTDFMFDSTRVVNQRLAAICCPMAGVQYRIAISCFHLMDGLRFNICDLPLSFGYDSGIADLSARINDEISSTLRYACCHWATHV
ncbi:hypothetical protein DFH08DRAFT_827729 [Mycena albidolilacea]|uniref:Nephrocystin 3-like N-terminal domain-containing protein n=1 Tax=Mycena albidolilacea TaxID=1033008 RepID=A0AAD6YXQ8_9AGAR|nr:hypothetical protein DFH08DRAFT_827729 [Mycena albidolilacea]